jgi:hypothetical protein
MTLAITTVFTSIASLTVAGVTIKDLGDIPPSGERITPILFPDAEHPLSNYTDERMSYGGGSSALMDVDYDLNYIFLYSKIGGGRTGLDYLEGWMGKVQLIIDAVIGIDTINGAVDIRVSNVGDAITMTDPAGNNYLGCFFTFHVKEFWR